MMTISQRNLSNLLQTRRCEKHQGGHFGLNNPRDDDEISGLEYFEQARPLTFPRVVYFFIDIQTPAQILLNDVDSPPTGNNHNETGHGSNNSPQFGH